MIPVKGLMNMKIDNGIISIEINNHGAEIRSAKKNNVEYMWCADEKFWGRCSPVLFPIVGGLKDKKYRVNGVEYSMGQHGFARDMDFELLEKDEISATYILKSNSETIAKYPFQFTLIIKYTLIDSTIKVEWKVTNENDKDMSFSIGAHPAFNLRDGVNYFKFDNGNDLTYNLIDETGLYAKTPVYTLKNDGFVEITKDMFDKDALIIENGQAKEVSLCDNEKKPYVTVRFSAPIFGLWSKPGAPFVCIEPWYGRCDRNDFSGEFSQRDHIINMPSGETFEAEYEIELL